MISHKHQFIFVHVGRTAGSSLERAAGIKITEDERTRNLGNTDFEEKHKHFEYYRKVYPVEFCTFFKFTIVRNPFERLVSRWLWQSTVVRNKNLSFFEFIETLPESSKYSEFFKLSGLSIEASIKYFDFIGRFEDLQNSYMYLCNKLDLDYNKIPHTNKTPDHRYQDYFNKESIELVRRIYHEDLMLFNYDF